MSAPSQTPSLDALRAAGKLPNGMSFNDLLPGWMWGDYVLGSVAVEALEALAAVAVEQAGEIERLTERLDKATRGER